MWNSAIPINFTAAFAFFLNEDDDLPETWNWLYFNIVYIFVYGSCFFILIRLTFWRQHK